MPRAGGGTDPPPSPPTDAHHDSGAQTMTTAIAGKPARTCEAKPGVLDTTRLFLSIRDQVYRIAPLKAQAPEIWAADRLKRADGKATHEIQAEAHGAHCTCGDHTYR